MVGGRGQAALTVHHLTIHSEALVSSTAGTFNTTTFTSRSRSSLIANPFRSASISCPWRLTGGKSISASKIAHLDSLWTTLLVDPGRH